ncbi:MAG: cation:proton antiporter [Proteobacteria bacterium]|nr:cation:proton antiporter [Pseudomonadota bacterium]
MEAQQVFIQLVIILVAARLCAEAAAWIGIPTVIGELTAGVILGPSVFGFLEATEIIRLLAEIAIILLLFEAGLESDIGRLAHAGRRAAVVALGGFLIPFALGFAVSRYVFDLDLLVALFVGGTLTATSIGVTLRILRDVGRHSSHEGDVVLGAAVVDDILGVLLLAVLYEFSVSGTVSWVNLGQVMLFLGVFFLFAPIAAKLLSYVIGHYQSITQIPGLVSTSIVSLVLFFAWLAHIVGAPELLGGFAAGLALSRRFFIPFGIALARDQRFSEEVEKDMKPIIQLFTPIFFVTVGLSLDLRQVDWGSVFIWAFSLSIAVLAIAGKIAGGFLLFREHWLVRSAIGMAMVPRGEVGLIFAELGRTSGVFDSEVYAAMILVIVYTTLFSPFWIKLFYKIFKDRPELK